MRGILAVAVLTAALAGCAGEGSTGGGTDTALPKGAELAAWADGAISENQTGGADYVVRATGTVAPGADVGVDISALSGPGTLSIACMTATGGEMSLEVDAPGDSGTETVVCAMPEDPASGTKTIVPISDAATLTVTSESAAVFVYAVSPPGAEPAR